MCSELSAETEVRTLPSFPRDDLTETRRTLRNVGGRNKAFCRNNGYFEWKYVRSALHPSAVRSGMGVWIILLTALCVGAQESGPSFTASIKAPRTAVSGESAIPVGITLSNQTPRLVFVEGLRTSPHGAGITVWDSEGTELLPVESARDTPGARRSGISTVIPPSKSITEFVNLAKWFDLSKPGDYTLQVHKRDPISKTMVDSNKITITVIPRA
jgi:hypothetical protein